VVNFNAVGGSTIMYTGHYPRLHPSDFRVGTLDGVADDWPIDYATWGPFHAENDRPGSCLSVALPAQTRL
jgi:choline dehydrogenase-like flavoprotein